MLEVDQNKIVLIRYTNYKGETAIRKIIPQAMKFEKSEWHPDQQWVLEAYDIDRQEIRSFAFLSIIEIIGPLTTLVLSGESQYGQRQFAAAS